VVKRLADACCAACNLVNGSEPDWQAWPH